MVPAAHDRNIVVKVVEKKTIVDKTSSDGHRLLKQRVVVADETGCMLLNVEDSMYHHLLRYYSTERRRISHFSFSQYVDLCEKLRVGEVVALHNAKVKLISNNMQLTFDKWGSIKSTTIAIPGDVQMDPNFSTISYNRVEGT